MKQNNTPSLFRVSEHPDKGDELLLVLFAVTFVCLVVFLLACQQGSPLSFAGAPYCAAACVPFFGWCLGKVRHIKVEE